MDAYEANTLRVDRPRPRRNKIQTIDALRLPDALVTVCIVTEATGFSENHISNGVRAGRFPAPREIGTSKRWVAGELTDWLKAQAEGREWKPSTRAAA